MLLSFGTTCTIYGIILTYIQTFDAHHKRRRYRSAAPAGAFLRYASKVYRTREYIKL